jgi:hypothetical protein
MNTIAMGTSMPAATSHAGGRYYRRFGPIERVMHAFLMITFIGCALTGVPLLFADHTWAGGLVEGTVRAGPDASGRFTWPSFVTDEGPIPVRVADLTVDPSGSSVTARYFVQPSAEDDLVLEIVERYEAGGDGRTLTGTMTVRFTGGETNRGGYVLHRRFERER